MTQQLFVFDVAGTLVDKGSKAPVLAFKRAFAAHSLFPTIDQIKAPMGKNKMEHVKDVLKMLGKDGSDQLAKEIYLSFQNFIVDAVKKTNDPIPGAVEAIKLLHSKGHKIAFTTGYDGTIANLALQKFDRRLPFTVPLVTASDSPGRPTPHMIYQAMLLTGTNDINLVWKIGDTLADYRAGVAAGLPDSRNIVVLSGNYQETEKSPPNTTLSVETFVSWVLELNEPFSSWANPDRVLTYAEVEKSLVSSLESHTENQKWSFNWEPVTAALEELRSLARHKKNAINGESD